MRPKQTCCYSLKYSQTSYNTPFDTSSHTLFNIPFNTPSNTHFTHLFYYYHRCGQNKHVAIRSSTHRHRESDFRSFILDGWFCPIRRGGTSLTSGSRRHYAVRNGSDHQSASVATVRLRARYQTPTNAPSSKPSSKPSNITSLTSSSSTNKCCDRSAAS